MDLLQPAFNGVMFWKLLSGLGSLVKWVAGDSGAAAHRRQAAAWWQTEGKGVAISGMPNSADS